MSQEQVESLTRMLEESIDSKLRTDVALALRQRLTSGSIDSDTLIRVLQSPSAYADGVNPELAYPEFLTILAEIDAIGQSQFESESEQAPSSFNESEQLVWSQEDLNAVLQHQATRATALITALESAMGRPVFDASDVVIAHASLSPDESIRNEVANWIVAIMRDYGILSVSRSIPESTSLSDLTLEYVEYSMRPLKDVTSTTKF
jgi:hypothetical protein